MNKSTTAPSETSLKYKLQPTNRSGKVILYMPDTDEGLDQITPPLGTLAIAGYLESMGIPILTLISV